MVLRCCYASQQRCRSGFTAIGCGGELFALGVYGRRAIAVEPLLQGDVVGAVLPRLGAAEGSSRLGRTGAGQSRWNRSYKGGSGLFAPHRSFASGIGTATPAERIAAFAVGAL
jgi:hypothetical protein